MTQSFELLKDPRITTSDADFAEQFDFLIQIRDKLSEIVTGVNTIRSLKRQLADWAERLSDSEVAARTRSPRPRRSATSSRPSRTSSCRSSSPPMATR